MKRARLLFVFLVLFGSFALGGTSLATPLDVGLALGSEIDGSDERLASRSIGAAGPASKQSPGLTMSDLIDWRLGSVRFSEPSSALLLGLGLLGLAVLSGRKFDVSGGVIDSSPR